MSRESLESRQAVRLRDLLQAVRRDNRFYNEKLKDWTPPERPDVDLDDLLAGLPFTRKAEIVADQERHPPYGTNLTYPVEKYCRLHQTSGTTGTPLRWLDTRESWEWFKSGWKQIYEAAGVGPSDRLFFAFSFGPFIGFWSAFECAQDLGNFCLSGGGMTTAARLDFLLENGVTVVSSTPTYALRMAEVADEESIDLQGSAVRALIVAGEPGGSIATTRSRIESSWGARLFDHAGMTEMGPYGFECQENPATGMHINEEEFIAEVLQPDSTTRVAAGEPGELVLTNLGRTASPLIRYRTGDLVCWDESPCACGRSFGRLSGGILSRVDDMVHVRGNNVFPSAVEAIIRTFREVAEYRVRVLESRQMTDLHVELEPLPATNTDALAPAVTKAIQDRLHFRPTVTLVPSGSLPRFEMKARRFFRQKEGRGTTT